MQESLDRSAKIEADDQMISPLTLAGFTEKSKHWMRK